MLKSFSSLPLKKDSDLSETSGHFQLFNFLNFKKNFSTGETVTLYLYRVFCHSYYCSPNVYLPAVLKFLEVRSMNTDCFTKFQSGRRAWILHSWYFCCVLCYLTRYRTRDFSFWTVEEFICQGKTIGCQDREDRLLFFFFSFLWISS